MIRALCRLASLCLLLTCVACGDDASGSSDPGGPDRGGAGAPDSDGPGTASYVCDATTTDAHACLSYADFSGAEGAAIDSNCKASGGTRATACPTRGRLGTCTVTGTGLTYGLTYYEQGGSTAAEAKESCESGGGTWAD